MTTIALIALIVLAVACLLGLAWLAIDFERPQPILPSDPIQAPERHHTACWEPVAAHTGELPAAMRDPGDDPYWWHMETSPYEGWETGDLTDAIAQLGYLT